MKHTCTTIVYAGASVFYARRDNWSAERLQSRFPTVPAHLIQKLLDGSAIICDQHDDGTFDIYEPEVITTAERDMLFAAFPDD